MEKISQRSDADALAKQIAAGRAKFHQTEKVKKGIAAVAGTVGSPVSILGPTGIGTAISTVSSLGQGVYGSISGRKAQDRDLRREADLGHPKSVSDELALIRENQQPKATTTGKHLVKRWFGRSTTGESVSEPNLKPSGIRQRVDKANEALVKLPSEDPEFGVQLLQHLAPAQMPLGQELALNREIQPSEAKSVSVPTKRSLIGRLGGGRTEVLPESTLKPSGVAQMARSEKSRLRQRAQMGAAPAWSLEKEREQEAAAKATAGTKPVTLPGIIPPIPFSPPLPSVDQAPRPEQENILKKMLEAEEKAWYERDFYEKNQKY